MNALGSGRRIRPGGYLVRLCLVLGLVVAGAQDLAAQVATYPNKSITMVVPYPAGGATDAAARLIANHLGKALGQPVVIENLAGASGAIAAQKVVRSSPDGYTLLAGTINEVVLAPIFAPGTPYKHQDLAAVGPIGVTPFVLVANPKMAARDIDELIAYVRSKPGTVNVGIPGLGSLQHVALSMLATQAKVEWTTVPYKGAAPLNVDLLGGQIDLAVVTLPSAVQYIQENKLKSLGLMSTQRAPLYKDIKTINEGTTIKGFSTDAWLGVFLPSKAPPDVVQKINAALNQALKTPELRDGLSKLGYQAADPGTSKEFERHVQAEDARYRSIAPTLKLER
ncbi:Bug family tripartite tricarboxylate transporter substrate binding protein [Variovorax sp. LT2P21]|uniref:Bug family tripartite tricarboxylate transporter substrate binding protein n=1 Tax=Variovorax sp. LT2P21 TaxID=3443731 RepID=UPI003F468705